MAAASQFADTLGLANRPSAPNAVQWSADGVLAVATGSTVVLASPANLQGPRAFASPGMLDLSMLQAPGQPADPTAVAHHEVAHLRMAAMVSQYPALQASLTIRSMAWSPVGCGRAAGCLLATVASDHQVLVFGPPAGPKSEWQVVADLSQQLLDHLQTTGWRDLERPDGWAGDEAPPDGAIANGGVLRLRGGGKRKRPAEKREVTKAAYSEQPPAEGVGQLTEAASAAEDAALGPSAAAPAEPAAAARSAQPVFLPEGAFEAAVGQAVEIMSPEEGLAGSWFTGAIREVRHGWALVAYDELKQSEAEDSPPLLEWFPLPGQAQGAAPQPHPPGEVHAPASGPQLRPAPPPEECGRGRPRDVGDICDCLIDGAWWEACRVVAVKGGKKRDGGTLEVVWGEERREVPLAEARSTLRLVDGRWELCMLIGVSGEAADGGSAQQEQQEGEGSPAKKQRAARAAKKAAATAAGAGDEAGAMERPKKKPRSRKQLLTPAPAAGAEAAEAASSASAADAAEAADALMAAAAGVTPAAAGKGRSRKAAAAGGASPARKTPARTASAPYKVPADFDASVLPSADVSTVGTAKSSLPLAYARRFLALRQEVPAEELPTYPTKSSHLKERDLELLSRTAAEILHVHGAALAELDAKLDAKWLDTQGRQKLRLVWDRTSNKLLGRFKIAEDEASEAEADEETDSEQEADEELGEGEQGRTRRRRAAGRTGSTPAQLDFPPHELPEDFSWRDLPGVDPSNEFSAKRTLVLAAVRRFLALRQEYPADELPSYPKSSTHLKGRDAWLQERVTRELSTAYSQLFMDLQWTVKAFQTYWLARLRQKWNRVDGSLQAGFSLEPEEVAPDVLLAVGEQSVAPSATNLPALLAMAAPGATETVASPAAPAAAEGAASPEPSAGATPAAGRGPRLLRRPSAKKPDSAATAAGSKGNRRAALSQEGEAESDEDSQGTGLTAPALRRRKELAASTAKARMRQSAPGSLSGAAYEQRLLGASALCCAWSPAVVLPPGTPDAGAASAGSDDDAAAGAPAAGARTEQQQAAQQRQGSAQQQGACCCFLAVGAKGGRIWLWRYRLPQRYSVDQPQGNVGERFQLVACLPGPAAAWVTSLAWQLLPAGDNGCCGSLVLAAGYSDGSVVLQGADARQLAGLAPLAAQPAGEPAAPPMLRWAQACPADHRGVACLALQLCPISHPGGSSSAGQRLLVAAGRTAGSLAVWRSGELSGSDVSSAERAKQLCSGAAGRVACSVQGTQVVTGLVWLPHQQRQEGQPLLLACTQDGAVACHRLAGGDDGGLALLRAAGSPQPCLRRRRKDQGHCALGLALSPGGLFAAVARLSLPLLAEMVKSLQVHERVVQGVLQLDCLAGSGAPLAAVPALNAALDALTEHAGGSSSDVQALAAVPALPAAAAWEVVALLRLLARQAAGPDAGLVPPDAGSILQRLEQPAHAAVQAATASQQDRMGEDGEEEATVLPRVPAATWRSLQLATALRHLLDPTLVVKGQQQRAKKQPRRVGGGTAVPQLLPMPVALPQGIKPENGQADDQQQQQQQAAQQLSPEQLAQHGAFASLMLTAQQPHQPAATPPAQQQQPPEQQQQQQGEEADEEGSAGQAQLLSEWHSATERNEMLLLQRHLAAALTAALPEEGEEEEEAGSGGAEPMQLEGAAAEHTGGSGAGEGSGAETQRSQLLMADWITLNVQDPQLLPEMLALAARAYMHHGEEVPAEMPARDESTLFSGTRVAVAGTGVAAATAAPMDGATLPRCPASLLLCERRPQWGCGACGRKYRRPAAAAAVAAAPACAPAVPACIFCGLLLGLSRPGVLFGTPCCG